ncbi:MAG: UvrD-helicase domain-containing protein [Bacteroidota bacterium]|nr:UvrD-helicase domain-containing protein [Bacteroidota bacterium]
MLTPSQLSALDLTSHTAIIANAGSGKTRVLVERYLKILLENPELHPRNVVAITFTDASARDLKKKISDELNERLTGVGEEPTRYRLLEIKRQLGSAFISTIHSFCIQLLRTYPVEAHVDASFTILTSPEDQLLREESLRATFYSILEGAYDASDSPESKLLPVFRLFGRRKVASLVHSFLGSRFRVNELIRSFYSKSDLAILSQWNKTIQSVLENEILSTIDLAFFLRLLEEKTTKGSNRQRAEEAVAAILNAETTEEKIRAYVDLIRAFYTKELTLNGNLFNKVTREQFQTESERYVEPFIRFGNLIAALNESGSDPSLFLNYCRQLLDIFLRVDSDYREQKIRYSLLDYDDVIEYALRLVVQPEIQAELSTRFAHILIDEYQDTDAAQYQIAKALTSNFQSSNRLTVVGDPKQSIYSFRNADLELYFETIKEISAAHKNNSPVQLLESFRMLANPVAFINVVSDLLFKKGSQSHGSSTFLPLIEGRNEEKEGSVEILLPELTEEAHSTYGDASESEEESIDVSEVQLIALKIKEIITNSLNRYEISEVPDIGVGRPPRYSDIAILLRNRTHQSAIEKELRFNGVPFVTYGGKGFYTRSEIVDITNYLRFLININDDIALAGILRSPYFAVSDVDLYRLTHEGPSESSMWQKLTDSIAKSPRQLFIRAYDQISKNLLLVGRVSTQFLLQKIISESGILGILQSLPDGDQKIANLEKFVRLSLSFGKDGYSGTYDFIERISLLMERDEMEAQAEPLQYLNAVHLMTIHNAKGLEFPVVFLPYLHSKLLGGDARRIRFTLDKELGLGLDLPEQTGKQAIVELIKTRAREREIEEEKRIFYVAMTRARDHLILSASPKKQYKNTRIGWVFESLGQVPGEDSSELNLKTSISRYKAKGVSSESYSEPISFFIPVIRNQNDFLVSSNRSDSNPEIRQEYIFYLDGVEPSESTGRYSPSQLLTYLECPTKYYLRYQLGLPEASRLPYYNEPFDLAENVQGSLLGQIVHKVLERSNSFIIDHSLNHSLLDEVSTEVCNDFHLSEDEINLFLQRVRADVTTVYASPLGKEALNSSHSSSELVLRLRLPNGQMLSGIVDKLFLDRDGVWNILDYKTEVRENAEKKKRYEFQLRFYAYLVSEVYNSRVVKAHVLYTRSGNLLSFTFTQDDFSGIGHRLESLVDKIKSQKKTPLESIERRLSHCPECAFFDATKDLCIAGAAESPKPVQTEVLFSE